MQSYRKLFLLCMAAFFAAAQTPGLNSSQQAAVVQALQRTGCTCGCSLSAAQCIATMRCEVSRKIASQAMQYYSTGSNQPAATMQGGTSDQALTDSYTYWRNRSLQESTNCTLYRGNYCTQAAADAQTARQALGALVMQATHIDGITSNGILNHLLHDEMDAKMGCAYGNQASCSQVAQIQQLRQVLVTKAHYSESDMDYVDGLRQQNHDGIKLQELRDKDTYGNKYMKP